MKRKRCASGRLKVCEPEADLEAALEYKGAVVRPEPPWKSLVADVYGRSLYHLPQKISFPFAGIGGPERALIEGRWPFEGENILEIRSCALKALSRLHKKRVKHADITKIDLDKLVDSDGLIGGSSCKAFSLNGERKGFQDDQGKLFIRQLEMVEELAQPRRKRPLRWVMLENVSAMLFKMKDGTIPLNLVQAWWHEHMVVKLGWGPLAIWTLDARDIKSAQQRSRVLCIAFEGTFNSIVGGIPECPCVQETAPLEPVLLNMKDVAPSTMRELTPAQMENRKHDLQ